MTYDDVRALILYTPLTQELMWDLIVELGYEPIEMPTLTYAEFLKIWNQRKKSN